MCMCGGSSGASIRSSFTKDEFRIPKMIAHILAEIKYSATQFC